MHAVVRGADLVYSSVPDAAGLSTAPLVGEATGSVHVEQDLCRLGADQQTPPRFNAFEESWYVLEGSGRVSVGDVTVEASTGTYGVIPVATPHAFSAGDDGLTWLRVRAPQPRSADPLHGVRPAIGWTPSPAVLRPSETDPRSRWCGVFRDEDMGPYGPLSMPGYHGPNIQSIFVRMLVDQLLGATQHTLFMVEFGPQATKGRAATEHYHPFEETYYLLSGSAIGTLDGEVVEVSAGDLVWTGINGTHGFVNEGDVPVRWLEVQAPVPPAAHAFYFPSDWPSPR
jgi:mannose-6-phosphate isomerase-like protein (cupin superfamily)